MIKLTFNDLIERINIYATTSIEEQKRVIELLRMELTKKDESIVETQTKLQADNQQASKDLAKVQKNTFTPSSRDSGGYGSY